MFVASPCKRLCYQNLLAHRVHEDMRAAYSFLLLCDTLELWQILKGLARSYYMSLSFKGTCGDVMSFIAYPEAPMDRMYPFFDNYGVTERIGELFFRRIYFNAMGMPWSMGYVEDLAQRNSGRTGQPLDMSVVFTYTPEGKQYLLQHCMTCYDAFEYIFKLFIYGGYKHFVSPDELVFSDEGHLLGYKYDRI